MRAAPALDRATKIRCQNGGKNHDAIERLHLAQNKVNRQIAFAFMRRLAAEEWRIANAPGS
jgi:hypothetical protein